MARDLLTPPVSTVASESAFSAGGLILDGFRSRLNDDKVECLVCMKDWEDARLRLQDRKDDIIEDFSNLEINDEPNPNN